MEAVAAMATTAAAATVAAGDVIHAPAQGAARAFCRHCHSLVRPLVRSIARSPSDVLLTSCKFLALQSATFACEQATRARANIDRSATEGARVCTRRAFWSSPLSGARSRTRVVRTIRALFNRELFAFSLRELLESAAIKSAAPHQRAQVENIYCFCTRATRALRARIKIVRDETDELTRNSTAVKDENAMAINRCRRAFEVFAAC